MNGMSIPSLDLFHRTTARSFHQYSPEKPNYYDLVKDVHRQKSYSRSPSRGFDSIYSDYHRMKPIIPTNIPVQQPYSLNHTMHVPVPYSLNHSHRLHEPCQCELDPKGLRKQPYLIPKNQKSIKESKHIDQKISIENNSRQTKKDINEKNDMNIKKDVYVNNRSLIQKITQENKSNIQSKNSMIKVQDQTISKFINNSNVLNTHQSIIIEDPTPQKRIAEHEVQTEDFAVNRSSFLIEKVMRKVPIIMNQKNCEKTLKNLNERIENLHLEFDPGDDIVIDLTDLVETKEEYMENSKQLLTRLQSLSQDKVHLVLDKQSKFKKSQGILWPQGV